MVRRHFIKMQMISQQEVIEKDTKLVVDAVSESIKEFESSRDLVTVTFFISGYDSDPSALFEIPEVRSWCKQLYQRVPFIFSLLDSETIQWFFPCLADVEIVGRVKRPPQGRVKEFLDLLKPKDRKDLTDQFSATAQIRYGPKTKELIDEILRNCGKLLQKLASSQSEFDRLAEEVGTRLRDSLSMIM